MSGAYAILILTEYMKRLIINNADVTCLYLVVRMSALGHKYIVIAQYRGSHTKTPLYTLEVR